MSNAFAEDNADTLLTAIDDLIDERLPDLIDELIVSNNLDFEEDNLIMDIQAEAYDKLMKLLVDKLKVKYNYGN